MKINPRPTPRLTPLYSRYMWAYTYCCISDATCITSAVYAQPEHTCKYRVYPKWFVVYRWIPAAACIPTHAGVPSTAVYLRCICCRRFDTDLVYPRRCVCTCIPSLFHMSLHVLPEGTLSIHVSLLLYIYGSRIPTHIHDVIFRFMDALPFDHSR